MGNELEKPSEVMNDGRYTTLDKLQRRPVALPNPNTYSEKLLGGLHPDEVHYANKDLVIIKGGGFHHTRPSLDDDDQTNIEAVDNTLDTNEPTEVRPRKTWSNVPIPFRYINGNLPTVVKPYKPSRFNSNRRYTPSYSNLHYRISNPFDSSARFNTYDNRQTTLGRVETNEIYQAQPTSYIRPVYVPAPPGFNAQQHTLQKRSADPGPKVVQYHYQTRGNDAQPIVNYQIHDNGDYTSGGLQITRHNANFIPTERKDTVKAPTPVEDFSELEDLSTPPGANPLIASSQTPKLRPFDEPQPPISLRGDTDVNFLPPLPRENPLAERRSNEPTPTPFRPSRRIEEVDRTRERQPSFFVPLHVAPTGAPQPPVVTPSSAPLTLAVETPTRRLPRNRTGRFMEPRRRRPIRSKSLNPRV